MHDADPNGPVRHSADADADAAGNGPAGVADRSAGTAEPAGDDRHPVDAAAARAAWDAAHALLGRAAAHPDTAGRVGRAAVGVRLRALDVEVAPVVLDLRDGLRLHDDDGSAPVDVEVGLATPDLERLAAGRLRLAMAIAAGRATYAGPVREFLRVLPVVQALARADGRAPVRGRAA